MSTTEKLSKATTAGKLSAAAHENIKRWLTEPKYATYRQDIEKLILDEEWQVLEDTFFQTVPFGTGGRRGMVGIGSNRINEITLGESAQGLANYVLAVGGKKALQQGVVVAHDTRTSSREFAEYVATIFAANGFITYLFDSFRATPELSFAVRHLAAATGVVISASHNPPSDNGFKAYWSDGGQIVPPHDAKIMEEVAGVKEIKVTDFNKAKEAGAIKIIGSEIDSAYLKALLNESLVTSRSASIVYSPLHGSGTTNVQRALEQAGFAITIVKEQASPDGTFPNIPNHIPNPEVPKTNEQATVVARKHQADIAITTDPDADRLGLIARDEHGTYHHLTGNQIAALLGFFVAEQMQEQKLLQPNHFFVKTIVTTDFLDAIAADFKIPIYNDILIGFKYVAELIRLQQDAGSEQFLFGGEESHGILKGSYARDKDAGIAALLAAEQASTLKDQGKTVVWQLNELYRRYGLFWETLEAIVFSGAEGFTKMTTIMAELRKHPPTTLAGTPVLQTIDRLHHKQQPGDVLIFYLAENGRSRITVRPSGTEPKLKIYTQLWTKISPDTEDDLLTKAKETIDAEAKAITKATIQYFNALLP